MTDYIKYYAYLCYLFSLDHYLYNNCDITFLAMFILLTHSDNLSYKRKSERPEKTHNFCKSVDWLVSHESVARIEPTISEVKGACSDDSCAIEAPKIHVGVAETIEGRGEGGGQESEAGGGEAVVGGERGGRGEGKRSRQGEGDSIKATITGCCITAQIGKNNEWLDGMRNNGNLKMEIPIIGLW